MNDPLHAWHRLVRVRDPDALPALLSEDVRFHSPVLHTPRQGRDQVVAILRAALSVLGGGDFRYRRECRTGRDAVLEFTATVDGLEVNGVDMIHWNERGEIDDFKVMLRPLRATLAVRDRMAEALGLPAGTESSA